MGARAGEAEFSLKDSLAIGSGDAGEGIEEYFKIGVRLEELLDQSEIKNFPQHLYVVCARINDLDLQRAIRLRANRGDVYI